MSSVDPRPDDVGAQLDKILSSPDFAQSDRLQKFLRFVVEETLAGRANALKEYTIALEVFERDESFDPQTSSIVRVEASRLRSKLEKYNAIEGRDDSVRISLPPGSYVPTFQTAARATETVEGAGTPSMATPQGAGRTFAPRQIVVLLAVVVVVLGVAALLVFDVIPLTPGTDQPPEANEPGQTYSIAVLPLRNLSGDADQDYFSDGLTDALIARIAKNPSMRVTSLTSVMGYKNVNRPIADIADELNVSHVIEGSVLRIGDKVRITAQLIEARTDRHLWAESYERNGADVLAIQNDVVRRIATSLLGQVASTTSADPADARSVDVAAHELYLRGLYFRRIMTEEGFKKGIAYFKKAVEKAPDYAEAYAGVASCYCLLGGHGFELVEPGEGMPAAKNAVLEALSLDNTLAEPHAFLGIIRLKYEWDWPGAETAFQRSIQLNPSYALVRLFYSFYLEAMGRPDEAILEAEQARALDPLSLQANLNLGWQYLRAGWLERARLVFQSTAELNPDFWGVHWGLGHYYRQKGDHGQAIAAFQRAVDSGGGYTLPLTDLGYTYAIAGQPAEARKLLDQLKALAEDSYVSPYNMATIHVGLGETDEAFAWLEKAFEKRSRSLAWLNVAKEYDGLRSDPRFQSLVKRVGLPE